MIHFTLMVEPNIYFWRSVALASSASSEGQAYKCIMGFILNGFIMLYEKSSSLQRL